MYEKVNCTIDRDRIGRDCAVLTIWVIFCASAVSKMIYLGLLQVSLYGKSDFQPGIRGNKRSSVMTTSLIRTNKTKLGLTCFLLQVIVDQYFLVGIGLKSYLSNIKIM